MRSAAPTFAQRTSMNMQSKPIIYAKCVCVCVQCVCVCLQAWKGQRGSKFCDPILINPVSGAALLYSDAKLKIDI